MRRGVAIAIALVALLTVSAFVAIPASVRASPSHPPSARSAVSTDSIASTDENGFYTSTFYPGLTQGWVYFYATDASDTTATIAINDYNATRDGLTNPVATVVAHFTGGVNNSYLSSTHLNIPLNLIFPGTWNITINGAVAGFATQNFTVHTYSVSWDSNTNIILPGHSANITYYLFNQVNRALYTHITSVTVTGWYLTSALTDAKLPGTGVSIGSAPTGVFTLNLPTNASPAGGSDLTFWANTSGWSEQAYPYVYTGALADPVIKLSTCSGACYTDTFQSGTAIVVTVSERIQSAVYSGEFAPAVGATLQILYEKGTSVVHPIGSPPTTLSTNSVGQAQWLLTADSNAFSTTGPNALNVTPADPAIPGNKGNSSAATFYVQKSTTSFPSIQVLFGAAQYYGGDTIFANWTLTGNASVTAGWNATYWIAETFQTGTGYYSYPYQGVANGTSGEITMVAPMGFNGEVYLYVDASNATASQSGESGVPVSAPQILLSSNEVYYQAGDSVTVTVTTLGSVLSGAGLQAIVTDSFGDLLQSGPLTGSTMTVSIPRSAPPTFVEFTVFAVATTGATISNASLSVDLASGYDLTVGVVTKSNYVDGSYQPGQSIQFSYGIQIRGYYTMPKAWTIKVWPSDGDTTGLGAVEMQTTSLTGTVSYTIPSNSPNGIQTFFIEATPTSGGYSAGNTVSVNVQSNPSGLGLELGAGSGLTIGWLVLLIIILVIAIVLFLAIRSMGRPKMMKPESGSPPSSPPAQSWQEQPSGQSTSGGTPPSGGSPPTPPAGST